MKYTLPFAYVLCASSITLATEENVKHAEQQLTGYAYAKDTKTARGEISGELLDSSLPLMSVFKLFIALAVATEIDAGKYSLDTKVIIPASEWEQDTWSPLRAQHRGSDATFTVAELLDAMLMLSDNIITDALIRQVGGIDRVADILAPYQLGHIDLRQNERGMQTSHDHAKQNRGTPRQLIALLRELTRPTRLSAHMSAEICKRMENCKTGGEKIRSNFPDSIIGNRSGSSGRDARGYKAADNDVAYIRHTDGGFTYIVILNPDTNLSDKQLVEKFRIYSRKTP